MTPAERERLRQRIDAEVRRRAFEKEQRRFCIECGEVADVCVCDRETNEQGGDIRVAPFSMA